VDLGNSLALAGCQPRREPGARRQTVQILRHRSAPRPRRSRSRPNPADPRRRARFPRSRCGRRRRSEPAARSGVGQALRQRWREAEGRTPGLSMPSTLPCRRSRIERPASCSMSSAIGTVSKSVLRHRGMRGEKEAALAPFAQSFRAGQNA
jgi:hypothetical protein